MKYLFLSLFFLFTTSLAGSSAISRLTSLTSESELLISAIKTGDVETVEKFLVGEKVNLNVLKDHGFDYVLSSKHASTILPVLLKHSNQRTVYKAIEKSIRRDDVRSFQLLLDAGLSPSFDDNEPVQLAARFGSKGILDLLLKTQEVDPTANANAAIRWASTNGNLEVVKHLLSLDSVDPSDVDNYAIRYASYSGHLEVVKLLLSTDRVDPTDVNNYAIRYASYNGHLEVVKFLLSTDRVDATDVDNYAIRGASFNGHLEVVKLLLSIRRVDPTDVANYAIRYASANGHLEVVKLLLSIRRVDPTDVDNYAIRYASDNGHFEVVQLLLSLPNVNPSALNSQALQWAVGRNHFDIVKLLITDGRVDPSIDNLAMFLEAIQMSLNPSFDDAYRRRMSDIVSFLRRDEMVSSILFLRSRQKLTPTRFLEMINFERAWITDSYIESVLKFPQVSDLLSGILGINREAAGEITTLKRLNEEMAKLMKSLEEDMNFQRKHAKLPKSLDIKDEQSLSLVSRKRWDFLWRYFGALREYFEEKVAMRKKLGSLQKSSGENASPSGDNASRFKQLTVWRLQNMNGLPLSLEPPLKRQRV